MLYNPCYMTCGTTEMDIMFVLLLVQHCYLNYVVARDVLFILGNGMYQQLLYDTMR